MRISLVIGCLLLVSSCATTPPLVTARGQMGEVCTDQECFTRQQRLFDALEQPPGPDDVQIPEDAPVRRVCVQWFVQAAPDLGREWLWRCMLMDDLRAAMFDPKVVEPQLKNSTR